MADQTKIEWADSTWNPVTGCTEVSPGCDHCYAKTFAERFRGTPGHYFEQGFDVVLRPTRLDQPLRWKRPRRIFVNSMSDLFHDDVPDDFIARVFAVMALANQHTFQLLTKRHGRMRSWLSAPYAEGRVRDAAHLIAMGEDPHVPASLATDGPAIAWPLPNVWLGVSVENQQWADIRIPALLDTPAAVRFLSMEPLLGPVNLLGDWTAGCEHVGPAVTHEGTRSVLEPGLIEYDCEHQVGVDWVIVGGESGSGARPMHPDWARSLRDQCTAAGVLFHFKQHGEWAPIGPDDLVGAKDDFWMRPDGSGEYYSQRYRPGVQHMVKVGKKAAGRELDGRTWDQFPKAVTTRG